MHVTTLADLMLHGQALAQACGDRLPVYLYDTATGEAVPLQLLLGCFLPHESLATGGTLHVALCPDVVQREQ